MWDYSCKSSAKPALEDKSSANIAEIFNKLENENAFCYLELKIAQNCFQRVIYSFLLYTFRGLNTGFKHDVHYR